MKARCWLDKKSVGGKSEKPLLIETETLFLTFLIFLVSVIFELIACPDDIYVGTYSGLIILCKPMFPALGSSN